ncbi:MAG: hypothetical protein RBT37_08510 [Dissulfurispiraceae bacterium]|jgi:endonuclease-3 related protein|nr:hypothetical protein [Dissulfurispiraceae bacterium]
MRKKLLKRIYKILHKHFGPQFWWPGDTPFEVAVGAILTQNTNWSNVEKAVFNLKKAKVLNASAMSRLQHEELAALIKPAGYFNVKAKRLKSFLDFLNSEYSGSMTKMKKASADLLRQQLLGVNGIGPETADSMLLYALNKPVFVIDAYTKRILSRHEIMDAAADYHEYQQLFHDSFDNDFALFNEYHALIVRLGKDFCRPNPLCSSCPIKSLLP